MSKYREYKTRVYWLNANGIKDTSFISYIIKKGPVLFKKSKTFERAKLDGTAERFFEFVTWFKSINLIELENQFKNKSNIVVKKVAPPEKHWTGWNSFMAM